jgi:hypothetical protein
VSGLNDPKPPRAPRTFADVLRSELELIEWRRKAVHARALKRNVPPPPPSPRMDGSETNGDRDRPKGTPNPLQAFVDFFSDLIRIVGYLLAGLYAFQKPRKRPPEKAPVEEPTPTAEEAAVRNGEGTGSPAKPCAESDADCRQKEERLRALKEHLLGLALSGGGIRSASFAVGVLQGLASLGFIRRIDYLSTVSGGGYAGGWLSAWLRREENPANVESQLAFSRVDQAKADRGPWMPRERAVDEEPEPIHHLREYSSYLSPRAGLMTVDTWTVVAIYIRNILINLAMLLPAILALVMAAALVVCFYDSMSNPSLLKCAIAVLLAIPLVYLIVRSAYFNAQAVKAIRDRDRGTYATCPTRELWFEQPKSQLSVVTLPLVIALVPAPMIYMVIVNTLCQLGQPGDPTVSHASAPFFSWPSLVLQPILWGAAAYISSRWIYRRELSNDTKGYWSKLIEGMVLATLFGAGLCAVVASLLAPWRMRADVLATFAPVAATSMLFLMITSFVALLGRVISPAEREWWARLCAHLLIASVGWLVTMGSIIYVPRLLNYLNHFNSSANLGAAVTWVGATATGVLAGKSRLTRMDGKGNPVLEVIAAVTPSVFLVGLLSVTAIAGSAMLSRLVPPSTHNSGAEAIAKLVYLRHFDEASAPYAAGLMIVMALLSYVVGHQVNVNLFSLNEMYANRLVRAFLGASRQKPRWKQRWQSHDTTVLTGAATHAGGSVRDANLITGFDPDDDFALADLRIGSKHPKNSKNLYCGPHLVINTTLNLVGEGELAWRNRKSESFVLTPLYCGSKRTGFAETSKSVSTLTVGRAMAISGAAIDPNMNFHQSPALTALLTIFNARLGWWMQNPGYVGTRARSLGDMQEVWAAKSPNYNDLFWNELFGETNSKGEFVHLSDGGHFDNLGVYELIRRRCRYIVVVDAGEDTEASDDNLATLIRLVRIDFGVRITLDTSPLKLYGPDRLSKSHCVIGEVHYDNVDGGELPGTIVYIKISMTGDEPSDLQQYASTHSNFPHTPTADQMFDEELFECYRALGAHAARSVFEAAVAEIPHHTEQSDPRRFNPRFFSALRRRWAIRLDDQDDRFLEATRAWAVIERDLRNQQSLRDLSRDLYPEMGDSCRVELHAISQMIQIMEDVWVSLRLNQYRDLPMNRGVMNTFRRWTATAAFHRHWSILRSQYGSEFVRFCEDQLLVGASDPVIELFDRNDARHEKALRLLAEEFRREWPDVCAPDNRATAIDLDDLVEKAQQLKLNDKSPVYLIWLGSSGLQEGEEVRYFICGIMLIRQAKPISKLGTGKPKIASKHELLIWIRRAHRSMGVGGKCADQLFRKLACDGEVLSNGLWIRYPGSRSSSSRHQERSMWMNFFSTYDFHLADGDDPKPDDELVLYLGGKELKGLVETATGTR